MLASGRLGREGFGSSRHTITPEGGKPSRVRFQAAAGAKIPVNDTLEAANNREIVAKMKHPPRYGFLTLGFSF